jgi:hypothetical protein
MSRLVGVGTFHKKVKSRNAHEKQSALTKKNKIRFLNGKLLRNEPCVNWLIVDIVDIAPVIYKPTPFRGWVIDLNGSGM